MNGVWALIMAGGQGTRLWPLSRPENPKQFLTLFGQKSLIENTVARVSKIVPHKRILIITDAENQSRIRRLFPKIPSGHIIGEPVSRNTAATVALAAALVERQDPDAVLSVFPSDHVILGQRLFERSVKLAVSWARRGEGHVLFGVKPTFPSTAYGYVEAKDRIGRENVFLVKRYIEKPPYRKAVRLYKNRRYFWQSGIFVFRAATILNSLRRFLPWHYRVAIKIASDWKMTQKRFPHAGHFARLPSISLDYGVMEKLKEIYMVPAAFDWNDIGSWNALESIWAKDASGNAHFGRVLADDAKGNLIYSKSRLIALLGVHDLAVIDSGDAVLVCPKSRAEEVRRLAVR